MKLDKKGMNLTFEQIMYITLAIIALLVVLIGTMPSILDKINEVISGVFH